MPARKPVVWAPPGREREIAVRAVMSVRIGDRRPIAAATRYIPYDPMPKQREFLELDCREAFYGGAAGPGKSWALLMAALQYVDRPEYSALLLRRTYADLAQRGALMDLANEWLRDTDAVWNERAKHWRFPSGATLAFGYMEREDDKYRYKGPPFQFVGWDELTQFSESQYRYMFSRQRRVAGSTIPLRMRAASNPGERGHDWVKARFIDPGDPERVYIAGRISDNVKIDREAYIESLMELDPITRQQLLDGDWSARLGGSKFRREWFEIVDAVPATVPRWVRYWDLAATEAKGGADPDWTVGVKMGRDPQGTYYIADVRRLRGRPLEVETTIKQTAQLDGVCAIRMEQEPGSSGVNTIDHYTREVLAGFDFMGRRSTGDKEVRANPLSSQAHAGNVKLLKAGWNAVFLDEIEGFPFGSHDDQVDAASGAFAELHTARWSGL